MLTALRAGTGRSQWCRARLRWPVRRGGVTLKKVWVAGCSRQPGVLGGESVTEKQPLRVYVQGEDTSISHKAGGGICTIHP
jgi:hypothetical protein